MRVISAGMGVILSFAAGYNRRMTPRALKTLLILIWSGVLLAAAAVIGLYFFQIRPGETPSPASPPPLPTAAFSPVPTLRATASPTALPVSQETPSPSPSPSPSPFPAALNPLTGLLVSDISRLERNPLSVKITNFPRGVRGYQFGTTRADVVYEYYIEDGLTRFIAVFYGQDAERAGPVRSGRYFDEHVARMYQAYLVFVNADERVEAHFLGQADFLPFLFLPREDNCPPLCRNNSIKDYNNFFVDTAGVTAYQAKTGHKTERVPLRFSLFDPNPPDAPLEVSRISLRYSLYSYHRWTYDPLTHRYWRESDAKDAPAVSSEVYTPHMDWLTQEQISAANVVVLIVPHNFNNDYDRADQVFNISLQDSGRAYIFREGKAQVGYWVRDMINQPILLKDEVGNLLPLSPGNTFYLVLNPESVLQQTSGEVRFTFFIPPRK